MTSGYRITELSPGHSESIWEIEETDFPAMADETGIAALLEWGEPVAIPRHKSIAHEAKKHLRQVFAEYARHVTDFSNALLGPLPDHVQGILGAASQNPAVAHRFAYGYANPTDFQNWLMDPAKAEAYLASVADQATPAS